MATSKGLLLHVLEVLAATFLLVVYKMSTIDYADPKGCEMVWMRPAYATLGRVENSRMGDKYSVHLYREGGIDDTELSPTGIPVVFIPGNAGSYKQGRSVASYCSKKTYEKQLDTKFDFYLIDFSEDLTAFHGRTMLDQAEYVNEQIRYILSLYEDHTNVIIIGHSMGGIVARTLPTLDNYVPKSVNTIITLSTPHTIPPLTFDRDVNTAYDRVNQYWRNSFSQEDENDNDLRDMVLISITGGRSDMMVPSDYTSVISIVPPSHGLTTFSSSIPRSWTGSDHLAIVWCSQVRGAIADSLFDIVDARGNVLPYNQRLEKFKGHLLPGFPGEHADDDVDDYDDGKLKASVLVKLGMVESQPTIKITDLSRATSSVNMLELDTGATVFTDAKDFNLYLCNETSGETDYGALPTRDLSTNGDGDKTYACYEGTNDAMTIPLSNETSQHPFINSNDGMKVWTYEAPSYNYLVFVSKSEGFLSANNEGQHKLTLPKASSNFYIPSGIVDVSLESATSSLVSYGVKVKRVSQTQDPLPFAPLLRQHILEPLESVFHVNVEKNSPTVSFHGPSPLIPYNPEIHNNLHLQFFSPPSNDDKYLVSVSVNFGASLANLALRYRFLAVTFPMAVTLLALGLQLRYYNRTGKFHHFQESLLMVVRKLPIILPLLTLAHFAISREAVRDFVRTLQIPSETENMKALSAFNPDIKQNDIYLGLTQPHFWFLGPFFFLIGIGLCGVLLRITKLAMGLIRLITPNIKPINTAATRKSAVRRFLFIAVVSASVTTFVPYQFAFILATLVQLVHTSLIPKLYPGNHQFYGLNEHVTILFLFNTFINAPIVIVWIHNLALTSTIHFTTHHNLLSVLPSILLVENIYTGNMLPKMNHLQRVVTFVLLAYYFLYIIFYGVLHTFMLHHLVNIFAGWLLVVYLDDPNTRHRIVTKKD